MGPDPEPYQVAIDLDGLGTASTRYVAPTPAGLQPFHRSDWARFVASPAAPFVLALLIAGLAALTVVAFARPRRSTLVERVGHFANDHLHPVRKTGGKTSAPGRARTEGGSAGVSWPLAGSSPKTKTRSSPLSGSSR